jgi:hypothetical protein
MDVKRIERAISVLKYAIENGVSVGVASEECGYTAPFVKNAKRDVLLAKERGTISKELYEMFMNSYQLYEGTKTSGDIENDTDVNIKQRVEGEQTKVEQKGDTLDITWKGDSEAFDKTFRGATYSAGGYSSIGSEEPPNDNSGNPYGWGEYDGNKDEEDCTEDGEIYSSHYGHQGYPEGHIKTLDHLLEKTGVDTEMWEVSDYLVNKWDVTSWKQGFPQTWENFQVKAKLKRIQSTFEAKQVEDVLKDVLREYEPPVYSIPTYKRGNVKFHEENNLLELGLYDLHIGKLAWAGETGENFDVKIAMKRFLNILEKLLQRANGFSYNRILFPIGNDFFNSDNLHNTTTAGTPQQEDLRWKKTFKIGIQLLISAIDMLKETGVPIDVVVIPGNHDFERAFYLGEVLEAWFNIDDQVNIDNTPPPRKYYKFGEVLLGLTHGKDEKENALPLLMATEAKEDWGGTTFHEWHLGHFHKKRNVKFAVFDKAQVVNEEHSVTVRYLSSLTGTEEWHHRKGYVGTQKAGEAFVWNDETGLIGHLNANFTDYDKEH